MADKTKDEDLTPEEIKRKAWKRKKANENLAKGRAIAAENKRKRDLIKMDEDLNDLKDKVDDKVDEQVKKALGKVDRKRLKDEVLQVFQDMGGRKKMMKWAKDNPGKYYTIMANIIKAETEKEGGGGGKVQVNIYGLEDKSIDITPTPQEP